MPTSSSTVASALAIVAPPSCSQCPEKSISYADVPSQKRGPVMSLAHSPLKDDESDGNDNKPAWHGHPFSPGSSCEHSAAATERSRVQTPPERRTDAGKRSCK